MASDYGDEAGGKLLDWMLRIGQEAGAEAMARSARELSERLAGIRGTIAGGRAEAMAAEGVPTYAKLSLEELSGLPEYATIKEVVSDKLRAASVEHHIIPGEGRDWLLFKVEDAPEVDEAFRQLEQETGKAAERARERLSEIAERRQAPERLAERAERAREASRAHSQGPGRDRGPRQIEGPAAIAASGANPILDPKAAMAAIPAALRAGRVFSAEALPLCAGTACACGALLAWARSLGTKGARRDGEEHGSSRWATPKDIAPFGDPKDPDNNIILTDNARIRLVSRRFDLSTDTNDNVLVVGGPGTGKTRYYVKPNLLQANASFFVTDPKGTLIREMGGALAELGYEIRAFDTIDFSRSMRFNPIAYIRDEAGVIRFARGIVANTEGEADHKGDPYWEKAERLVYTALTAYLVMHCEPADRNLDGLLTLLSLADARDDPGYMSPLDMVFRELETGERYVRRGGASAEGGSLRGFAEEDGAWEWVKVREPAPPDDFALASYREFRVAAGDTMKSMLSSCNVRLKPLSIRAVRDLTSKDELDLAHMGDEGAKVALFASMSDTDSTFDFLFALLMDTAVSALCAEALEAHGGSLPTTVHFVFDEFANIGRIPDFERTIAVTRSRNIAVSMIAQSLSQLKETYGDNNAETIVNACDTLLYLGGKANETNEEISKMAGKQTVASETQSDSRGAGWTRTVNRGISERDLIQPAEVARMPREDALVLVNGCMPLMDRKYRLERHPRSRLLEGAARRGPFDFAEYRRRKDGAS